MPNIDLWQLAKDCWQLMTKRPAVAIVLVAGGVAAWGGYQYGIYTVAEDDARAGALITGATTDTVIKGMKIGILYEVMGYRHLMSNPECPPNKSLMVALNQIPLAFAEDEDVLKALDLMTGVDIRETHRALLDAMAEAVGLEPAPLSVPVMGVECVQ